MNAVTELHAARRYLTNVLLYLSIDADNMTVLHFIQLLDYFAEHPEKYLELTNAEHPWLRCTRCRTAVPRSTGPRLTRTSYVLSQSDTQPYVWSSHFWATQGSRAVPCWKEVSTTSWFNTMTDYEVLYVDKDGDKQDFTVTSSDVRTAMNNLFELCPDARRIIRCAPKPMFQD